MSRLTRCGVQKKFCYPSKVAAINSAIRSSRKRGTALRVYWHADCKSYHLTSQPREEYLAKRSDTQHVGGAA